MSKTIRVRVEGCFHRLQISKNIKFQTRLQWKRHQNKSESRLVSHEHGFSTFEQVLGLDLNMQFDETRGVYEDKNTEVVAIIMYEGKVKSGGYAKYNIAQVLNQRLEGKLQTIPLSQCPDPNANVQVTFTYRLLDDYVSDDPSVLNVSSRDLNMSRVDFNDDKISLEMERINSTIAKLAELARVVKDKDKSGEKIDLLRKLEELQGEKTAFATSVKKLEVQLEERQKQNNEDRKRDKKLIAELQKQLQRKDKETNQREGEQVKLQKRYKQKTEKHQKQALRYKQLYQQTLAEFQQFKNNNLRGSLGFGRMEVEDVHEIAKFEVDKDKGLEKQLEGLKAQNAELQGSVASFSYKLAQLFNASYEFGGARLLDYLQTSIGLTER